MMMMMIDDDDAITKFKFGREQLRKLGAGGEVTSSNQESESNLATLACGK